MKTILGAWLTLLLTLPAAAQVVDSPIFDGPSLQATVGAGASESSLAGDFCELAGCTMSGPIVLSSTSTLCSQTLPLSMDGDSNTGVVRGAADSLTMCAGGAPVITASKTATVSEANVLESAVSGVASLRAFAQTTTGRGSIVSLNNTGALSLNAVGSTSLGTIAGVTFQNINAIYSTGYANGLSITDESGPIKLYTGSTLRLTLGAAGTATWATPVVTDATNTLCSQALSMSFSGDSDTGLQRSAANTMKLCANGIAPLTISDTLITSIATQVALNAVASSNTILNIVGSSGHTGKYIAIQPEDQGSPEFSIEPNGTSGSMKFLFRPDTTGATGNMFEIGNNGAITPFSVSTGFVVSMFGPTFTNNSVTYSNIAIDETTGTNEDFTIDPNGTGKISLAANTNLDNTVTSCGPQAALGFTTDTDLGLTRASANRLLVCGNSSAMLDLDLSNGTATFGAGFGVISSAATVGFTSTNNTSGVSITGATTGLNIGATTDITTGSNQDLTLSPNGTGKVINVAPVTITPAASASDALRITGATGHTGPYFNVRPEDDGANVTAFDLSPNGTSGSLAFTVRPVSTGASGIAVSLGTSSNRFFGIATNGAFVDTSLTVAGAVSGANVSASTTGLVLSATGIDSVLSAAGQNQRHASGANAAGEIAVAIGSTDTGVAETLLAVCTDCDGTPVNKYKIDGNGHHTSAGATPSSYTSGTCTNETGTGDDYRGQITADCTAGQTAIVTFNTAYGTAPTCVCSAANAAAGATTALEQCSASTTVLTVTSVGVMTAGKVNFICIE